MELHQIMEKLNCGSIEGLMFYGDRRGEWVLGEVWQSKDTGKRQL